MVQELFIDFRDTNSTVNIPLGENVVLFGENGAGKTRVLRTIHSIIELSKASSSAKLSNILKDLNIENFKLNGVKYDELFKGKTRLVSRENDRFREYFQEYKELFKMYVEMKMDFISTGLVIDNFSNADIRRCREALDYFVRSDFPNDFSPNLIRRWAYDTSRVSVSLLKDDSIHSSRIERDLYEYERIIEQVINNYVHNFGAINALAKTQRLDNKKSKLKKELASKSSIVISTGEKDFELFFTEIRKRVLDFKTSLFNSLWEQSGTPSKVIDEINLLKRKVIRFNDVISRYFNLVIELDRSGEFTFYKSGSELEISKFSSGERNIIFLFFNLIFIDVDIYLIDEPEISLSLSFQKRIVGDIFDVVKGKSVIIATHAPYIYKDFKSYSTNNKVVKIENNVRY
ncbi:AAA family ATPase [Streptococcus hillyeri]|uniref:ATP-binding cassette domain-containing protein n=1 Tax=Streptococcus hillyeri TaxID=2282420 RepID=A0A3L9DU19_9STRE|nr:AAA family ATPase [Streptococcus hillyeri]RLY02662.1 ATP-binding cassette domain-containing protein [Streptococcus hillyeri]